MRQNKTGIEKDITKTIQQFSVIFVLTLAFLSCLLTHHISPSSYHTRLKTVILFLCYFPVTYALSPTVLCKTLHPRLNKK